MASGIPSTSRTSKLRLENVVKLYLKVRSFSYTKDYVAKYKIKEKEVKTKALRKDMKQSSNKTPAQAFTPPAHEKKMGTIWIFVYYAVYSSDRARCRDFLVLGVNMGFKSSTGNRKNCFSNTIGF